MTSDQLFWRLVLVSRSVDEATLLWWLTSSRADERASRLAPRTLESLFGVDRKQVVRARRALESNGLVESRVLADRYAEARLDADRLASRLARTGQTAAVDEQCAPRQFDPFREATFSGIALATACSRICMLRGNREDAILLAWLHQAGAADKPIRVSSRDMETCLGGLVDRRTAMRALTRLESDGFVSVSPLGRVGTEYRLDGEALAALLSASPINEDAAAMMPGWSNLSFPLLQRLDPSSAEATTAVLSVALEV
jgi:hypothetical protein